MSAPKKTKRPRGHPPLAGGGAKRVLVTLDRETIARARKIGCGNLSAGLRIAVARLSDR